jgi:hypothetical protein
MGTMTSAASEPISTRLRSMKAAQHEAEEKSSARKGSGKTAVEGGSVKAPALKSSKFSFPEVGALGFAHPAPPPMLHVISAQKRLLPTFITPGLHHSRPHCKLSLTSTPPAAEQGSDRFEWFQVSLLIAAMGMVTYLTAPASLTTKDPSPWHVWFYG